MATDEPAKPTSRIAATFEKAEQAVDWMAGEYAKVREALLLPDRVPLEDRLETALDLLSRGVDAQWGEWPQGGRFATIGVICCPNRQVAHPLPDSLRETTALSDVPSPGHHNRPWRSTSRWRNFTART
ncbi:hypothetical protein ACIHFD_28775 [Nonomuraea sp. NPDC051941]|uniref:hypothetical protein n=1 Tax=Nonomuraea sp. NPDC051941 TaxID=3364373 RepID=UPI0037CACA01